jgi:hypothetical protein
MCSGCWGTASSERVVQGPAMPPQKMQKIIDFFFIFNSLWSYHPVIFCIFWGGPTGFLRIPTHVRTAPSGEFSALRLTMCGLHERIATRSRAPEAAPALTSADR